MQIFQLGNGPLAVVEMLEAQFPVRQPNQPFWFKQLWVDAVNHWSVESAIEQCRALQELGATAIQSPIPFEDVAGLARINHDAMPVVATESEFSVEAFEALIRAGAVSHLQFCLPLCGGLSGATRLDRMAMDAGVTSTLQCYSTAIVQAATLHFSAARENVVSAEFHCFHDHLSHLYLSQTAAASGGKARAGTEPGLNVRVPDLGVQRDGSLISLYANLE